MSAVEELKRTLASLAAKTTVFKSGSSLIPKPDYAEIDSRIRPFQRGASRGAENIPPLGTKEPDEVELAIYNSYAELVSSSAERATELLGDYNERILSLDLTSLLEEVRDVSRGSISDFKAAVHADSTELILLDEEVRKREADLQHFREALDVNRSAHYPDAAGRMLRWGLIAVMFLVETAASATFLAKGSQTGFVGGYGEAVSFALLNIGMAVLIGSKVARRINLKAVSAQIQGWAAIIFGLALAAVLNLLLAHYRELAGIGLFGQAGTDAVHRISNNPFGLVEVQSWILFGMGLLFWLIAIVDAYGLDDAIPGYGALDRAVVQARLRFVDHKEDVIEDLKERRILGENMVRAIREQLSEVHSHTSHLFSLRNQLKNDWASFVPMCQSQMRQMLESYRNANREARTRAPASFNKQLSIPEVQLGNDSLSLSIESIAEQVALAKAHLQDTHDAFYREFDQAVERFARLDSTVARGVGVSLDPSNAGGVEDVATAP